MPERFGRELCFQAAVRRGAGGADSELSAVVCGTIDRDFDGDGQGDALDPCPRDPDDDADDDGLCALDDCDPGDPGVGAPTDWYLDDDGDGLGAGAAVLACEAPIAHVAADGDCDDSDGEIFPGAPERCNDIDDDCDSVIDNQGDAACDDGLFCNGTESCAAGACADGVPPRVDDGVDCTTDRCDEELDIVVHDGDDATCSDGQFCNGEERCLEGLGCASGVAPDLDDGVSCTIDLCDEGLDEVLHLDDICEPPAPPDVGIEGSLERSDLRCTAAVEPGLSATVEWTVDGVAFAGAQTTTLEGDTVPASATVGGERWTCTVTVSDGYLDARSSAEVVVGACWDVVEAIEPGATASWGRFGTTDTFLSEVVSSYDGTTAALVEGVGDDAFCPDEYVEFVLDPADFASDGSALELHYACEAWGTARAYVQFLPFDADGFGLWEGGTAFSFGCAVVVDGVPSFDSGLQHDARVDLEQLVGPGDTIDTIVVQMKSYACLSGSGTTAEIDHLTLDRCGVPDQDGDGIDDVAVGGTDCDDSDSSVHPAAAEVCNGLDDNCDGLVDEGC